MKKRTRAAAGLFELQAWARRFDTLRGWDRVSPRDTAVHLMEETGEVARVLLGLSGYKPLRRGRKRALFALSLELSDVVFLCLKLANQYGIDLAAAADAKVRKNERRFPPTQGRRELSRYLAVQARDHKTLTKGRGTTHRTF